MKKTKIHLLATSDIHGYVYPTLYREKKEEPIGLAKVATIIQQRRRDGQVILIDNGDLIQGSPLTYYHAKFKSEVDNPIIQVANYLHYDAAIFGNHEFNFGLNTLSNVVGQSRFPWLGANIVSKKSSLPYFGKPYIIKEIEGIRLAILGVTTHFVPLWEEAANIEGLQFEDAFQATEYWCNQIIQEEKVDVLIVAYHGGFERDLQTAEYTEQNTGENQGFAICESISNIDVLITGHQHRLLDGELNGVAIVQPGTQGQAIGEVIFSITHDSEGKVVNIEHEANLITIDECVQADPTTLEAIAAIQEETEQWLDQRIGKIKGNMQITNTFQARMEDHPYVEFINKLQMKVSGAVISSTALFNNDAQGFSHSVTMRDIVSNYIYPNTLKVLQLTGQDIKDALEQCATYFSEKNGEIIVNLAFAEPKAQHYNYDMWEGIEYELKISNPIGERVTKLVYEGLPIKLEGQYPVVMNSYRASGAGNFDMFKGKPILKEIQTDMTELIANELLIMKEITATCNHNWRVLL
ncbi:bifunctional metallophosphatase/5'-nucleotidase [Viridibacillus sp. YIM B01967]|uniref:Bifunctional metallophosphatase/5'-nucleotidase n=1 Tax=Viridibacillus soli TaxID=2798301 RepID=A0ABS1H8T2_9BACL|nr:bifunctional UDP-sugar hydrolase/5'-nucleotidase [Viridibacillus soli]MBK3495830.1 bifunctional metallophosphatase/5'-nucleotidase [Viridibacillus soli]